MEEETNTSVEEPGYEEKETPKDNSKEYNFAELRKKAEAQEKRATELEEELQTLKAKESQKETRVEESEDWDVADDDLVEAKHLKKIRKELNDFKQALARKEQDSIPEKLQSKYSDFYEVVSKDNLSQLQKEEPELYAALDSTQDSYKAGIAAYKALKKMGYYNPEAKENERRALENSSKPRSTQSVASGSPLHDANRFAKGLTSDLKKQLQKEMTDAIKGR